MARKKTRPNYGYEYFATLLCIKRDQAATALTAAKAIEVRLRAMRDARTGQEFSDLLSSLKFDMDRLNYLIQTL